MAVGREQKYRGAAVGSMVRLDLDPDSGSAGDHARVGKYLDETGVAEGFTNLLCGLIKHQPADPARWLVEETARIYSNEDREAEQEQERQRGERPSARTLRRRRSKAKARALAGRSEQVQQVVQQVVEAVEFPRKVQKGKKRSKGKEARRQFCSKRKAVRAMVQAQKRAKKQCRRLQHEGKQRQNLQKVVRQQRETLDNHLLLINDMKHQLGWKQ